MVQINIMPTFYFCPHFSLKLFSCLSTALSGQRDQILAAELNLANRRQKREIKQLEEENERWKVRKKFIQLLLKYLD